MGTSLREAAKIIDPLFPPTSVNSFLRRFRYVGVEPGELPVSNSVKSILIRLDEPNEHKLLLHYNCYLLEPRIELRYLVEFYFHGWAKFLICLGLAPVELLTKVLEEYSNDDICNKLFPPIVSVCGVSANPLNNGCKLFNTSLDIAIWLLGTLGKTIDFVFDVIDVPFDLVMKAFSAIIGFKGFPIKAKSKIPERALEIGAELLPYDIISLVEVWDNSSQKTILAFGNELLKDSDGNFETYKDRYFTGPGAPLAGSWKQSGSGILVVVPNLQAFDGGNSAFNTDGVHRYISSGCDIGMIVDVDRFSNKGIQLTVVDLGFGKIDLYSTHMYSGGGGETFWDVIEPVNDKDRMEVRDAQLIQLASFITNTHNPNNIAIVVGDFNIAAQNAAEYSNLTNKLKEIPARNDGEPFCLYDLWAMPAFRDILDSIEVEGSTNRNGDDIPAGDFSLVCAQLVPYTTLTGVKDDFFCDDSIKQAPGSYGSRIDYIFIEKPTTSHSFILDTSKIRRRAFKRKVFDEVGYMSDHLGLEITLIPNPL